MNRSGKRLWNLHELARIVDGILLEPTHCCWRKPLTTNADLIPKRPLKKWGACVTTPANVSVQLVTTQKCVCVSVCVCRGGTLQDWTLPLGEAAW